MFLDTPPVDTAIRRDPLPMTVIPDWMSYEEYKKSLPLNLSPIAYEALIKAYCDKHGL